MPFSSFRLQFPRYARDHDSLETVNLSQLPESEKWRIEHHRLHEKHRGHEAIHGEVAVVVVGILLVVQLALMVWRRRHFTSYQRATLLGLWLIPGVVCVQRGWVRFLLVWAVFSAITAVLCRRASRRPVVRTTPRWVYKWFLLLDKASYLLGLLGYVAVVCGVVGLDVAWLGGPQGAVDTGLLLLFYGLYFGVIARDVAEVCTDTMAAYIGYCSDTGLPSKSIEGSGVCALCGNHILVVNNADAIFEKTIQLNCDHVFHEFCIRGWCIVGKKQTCPYCKEKVDLQHMFPGPDPFVFECSMRVHGNQWERPRVLYRALLGWIRYLVAWQPVIIGLVEGIKWISGQE